MNTTTLSRRTSAHDLATLTAADLMVPEPFHIRGDATDEEAIRVLTDRGVTALIVIGDSGRPLGVLTATDVLIHQRAKNANSETRAGYAQLDRSPVRVCDMMTPAVFSVRPETPALQVVEQMVAMNVHRLFVVDDADIIVGVVSALGVLRGMVRSEG